jgi:hypothetical protein
VVADAGPARRPPTRRRRRLAGALILLLVLAAGLVAAAAGGRYDSRALAAAARPGAPAWTRPCRAATTHPGAEARRCVRVRGRIAWIQRHDPDGDGDRHLVLVERGHVRLVKVPLSAGVGRLPGIGHVVEATGPTLTGASGRSEVVAGRLAR